MLVFHFKDISRRPRDVFAASYNPNNNNNTPGNQVVNYRNYIQNRNRLEEENSIDDMERDQYDYSLP